MLGEITWGLKALYKFNITKELYRKANYSEVEGSFTWLYYSDDFTYVNLLCVNQNVNQISSMVQYKRNEYALV